MKINKVLSWNYHAYNKAVLGREPARASINIIKKAIRSDEKVVFYNHLKKWALRLICGPFYWPSTFPNGVDQATAELLYSLVRLTKPEVCLEIGTSKGNSAIAIAQALEDNEKGKLYTIDIKEEELAKIAIRKSGLKNRIERIIDYSTRVIPKMNIKQADFVFIDGDHQFEAVQADFLVVKDLVKSGGIIVFHDTMVSQEMEFDGPQKVVEQIKKEGEYETLTLPTEIGREIATGKICFNKNLKSAFEPFGFTVCRKL